jgi:hypothetical protein
MLFSFNTTSLSDENGVPVDIQSNGSVVVLQIQGTRGVVAVVVVCGVCWFVNQQMRSIVEGFQKKIKT